MASTIRTNDGRQYEKPGYMRNTGAFIAGTNAAGLVALSQMPFLNYGLNKIRKLNLDVDTVEISKGLDKALEVSKMKDAGVKIIEPKFRVKPLSKNKLLDKMIELFQPVIGASRGRNAVFFMNGSNQIMLNKNKIGTAGFHEIGHAINRNSSKFWKTVQNIRFPGMALASVILLTALLKRKKADGEEPKGFFDKSTTFVKENAGKLSMLVSLPVFAEELKASLRGNKLAKQVLSPELYKKVVKTNKWSTMVYLSGVLAAGLTGYLASKTRDAVAHPKEIKA